MTHTCDIILDANREIWALKSYFVFRNREIFFSDLFFSEVQKSRNLVIIARNLLPNITMLIYANRSEKIRPFTL